MVSQKCEMRDNLFILTSSPMRVSEQVDVGRNVGGIYLANRTDVRQALMDSQKQG
jgi:hypothetical protein